MTTYVYVVEVESEDDFGPQISQTLREAIPPRWGDVKRVGVSIGDVATRVMDVHQGKKK